MKEHDHRYRFVSFLSGISVLLSLLALLAVFRYCYPEVERDVYAVIAGLETSPIRQAFYTMAEGFEEGESIKETVRDSVKVLFE